MLHKRPLVVSDVRLESQLKGLMTKMSDLASDAYVEKTWLNAAEGNAATMEGTWTSLIKCVIAVPRPAVSSPSLQATATGIRLPVPSPAGTPEDVTSNSLSANA